MEEKRNMVYDQERIDVMTWLRFPLILGVVVVHCNLFSQVTVWEGSEPDWPGWLIYIFNNFCYLLLPARVPTLFLISGYFFFRSNKKRDSDFFIYKFGRRVHSLLIPYIAWNTIAIAILYIRFNVISDCGYSLADYLSGYWDFTQRAGNDPADGPLWFIRNLMVVSLTTPVLYLLLKRKVTAIIFISALILFNFIGSDVQLTGLSNGAFLFFSTGACLAIHDIDFTRIPHKAGIPLMLMYIPSQLILNTFDDSSIYAPTAYLLTSAVKIPATLYIVSLLFRKGVLKPTPELTKISFLLYAIHGIIVGMILKSLYITMDSNNPAVLLGIYIATPCIIIAISYMLHAFLSRKAPFMASILLGKRK